MSDIRGTVHLTHVEGVGNVPLAEAMWWEELTHAVRGRERATWLLMLQELNKGKE